MTNPSTPPDKKQNKKKTKHVATVLNCARFLLLLLFWFFISTATVNGTSLSEKEETFVYFTLFAFYAKLEDFKIIVLTGYKNSLDAALPAKVLFQGGVYFPKIMNDLVFGCWINELITSIIRVIHTETWWNWMEFCKQTHITTFSKPFSKIHQFYFIVLQC